MIHPLRARTPRAQRLCRHPKIRPRILGVRALVAFDHRLSLTSVTPIIRKRINKHSSRLPRLHQRDHADVRVGGEVEQC